MRRASSNFPTYSICHEQLRRLMFYNIFITKVTVTVVFPHRLPSDLLHSDVRGIGGGNGPVVQWSRCSATPSPQYPGSGGLFSKKINLKHNKISIKCIQLKICYVQVENGKQLTIFENRFFGIFFQICFSYGPFHYQSALGIKFQKIKECGIIQKLMLLLQTKIYC